MLKMFECVRHPCQLCLRPKWKNFHHLLSHSDFARIEKFHIYEKFSASVGTPNMLRRNSKGDDDDAVCDGNFCRERKFENQVLRVE